MKNPGCSNSRGSLSISGDASYQISQFQMSRGIDRSRFSKRACVQLLACVLTERRSIAVEEEQNYLE